MSLRVDRVGPVAQVTAADARFSVREVKVATVADLGSRQRLAGMIGEGHLRELALTGKDIDAVRAERIGLVNDVYPDGQAALDAPHEDLAEAVRAFSERRPPQFTGR